MKAVVSILICQPSLECRTGFGVPLPDQGGEGEGRVHGLRGTQPRDKTPEVLSVALTVRGAGKEGDSREHNKDDCFEFTRKLISAPK